MSSISDPNTENNPLKDIRNSLTNDAESFYSQFTGQENFSKLTALSILLGMRT